MHRSVLALAVLGSVVGLALGAGIHALGRGRGRHVVDGLVLGAIPLLIAVRVLPHVYEELGRSALVFVGLGFFALVLADRGGHEGGERVSRAVLVPTLLVHALADGAALALAASGGEHGHGASDVADHGHDHGHGHDDGGHHGEASGVGAGSGRLVLVAAIVAHRLPEGLLVCGALVPLLGWPRTLGRLGGIALATIVGSVAGRSLLTIVPDRWLDAVVAFGVGAMLRLAVHTHDRAAPNPKERIAAGVAFVVGVSSVLMIPDPDSVLARAQPTELSVARSLVPLFIETAPAMALAMLAMLVARIWDVRKSWLTSALFSSGQREGGAWLARAQRDGRGERMALWGAFAAAALGLDALALSLGWFGPLGASLRWAVAAALPLVWLGANPPPIEHDVRLDAQDPVRALASNAGWYAVGLLAGAVAEAALATNALAMMTGPRGVIIAVLAAAIVPVPMTAAIAVAAVLAHKGAGVEAVFAWLWTTALRGAVSSRYWLRWVKAEPKRVIPRLVVVCVTIVALSLSTGAVGVRFPELHPRLAHAHVPFEWVCVGISAAVLLGILLRLGPRAVLESMAERRTAFLEHEHEHEHGDGEAHEHEHEVTEATAPEGSGERSPRREHPSA
jgi:hypothetical protein